MGEQTDDTTEDSRLLIEIIDIAGEIDTGVIEWVRDQLALRTALGSLGPVEAWLGDSDDAGPLGTGRNRIVLISRPASTNDASPAIDREPAWLEQRHVYDATPVSNRSTPGRPAPNTAGALRFVAMNCADGAEEEFHSWYEKDHLPRFTSVPGVFEGRRLHAPDSPRKHLALYWLADVAVVHDPMWKSAAGTDWTTDMRKKTFDRDRINLVPFPFDLA